jgi:hypothetical protein
MCELVRRAEVETWSDLASLIPAGQQLFSVEQAFGNRA